jgi:hypothetical protein
LCHKKVRKEENGRGRNATNHYVVIPIYCGKLRRCPEAGSNIRIPLCKLRARQFKGDMRNEATRPGGQPGGSSHMGAGVDGRSRQIRPQWKRCCAPTASKSPRHRKRSNASEIFWAAGR